MHIHWRCAALLGLVSALGAGTVLAQSDFYYDIEVPEATEALVVGDPVEAELTEDTPIFAYSIDLTAEDSLSINVDFDEFDGYLLIADEGGDIVAYNDDGDGTRNSRIVPFQPEQDGTYRVVVSSYSYITSEGDDPSVEGDFELTAASFEAAPIAVGDEVEGELTRDATTTFYTLDIAEGQILALTLESDDFDAKLTVTPVQEGDQGELSNDDFGGSSNSQIGPYLFSQAGSYIVAAQSYSGEDEGDFTLLVTAIIPTPLELGTTRGELTLSSTSAFYSFEGVDEQEIDILVEAVQRVDLKLTVYGPDGVLVAENDDYFDRDPQLPGLQLEADGTYVVVVSPAESYGLEDSDVGEFDITLDSDTDLPPGDGANV